MVVFHLSANRRKGLSASGFPPLNNIKLLYHVNVFLRIWYFKNSCMLFQIDFDQERASCDDNHSNSTWTHTLSCSLTHMHSQEIHICPCYWLTSCGQTFNQFSVRWVLWSNCLKGGYKSSAMHIFCQLPEEVQGCQAEELTIHNLQLAHSSKDVRKPDDSVKAPHSRAQLNS